MESRSPTKRKLTEREERDREEREEIEKMKKRRKGEPKKYTRFSDIFSTFDNFREIRVTTPPKPISLICRNCSKRLVTEKVWDISNQNYRIYLCEIMGKGVGSMENTSDLWKSLSAGKIPGATGKYYDSRALSQIGSFIGGGYTYVLIYIIRGKETEGLESKKIKIIISFELPQKVSNVYYDKEYGFILLSEGNYYFAGVCEGISGFSIGKLQSLIPAEKRNRSFDYIFTNYSRRIPHVLKSYKHPEKTDLIPVSYFISKIQKKLP